MRCTCPLQRENEPDVSEMGTAGEARQCGSLTSCNVRTSRTSAKWQRRVWGGDGFTYLLQRENEPNVSKMATAGRGAVIRFTYRLQRDKEPDVSEMATAGEAR